MPMLRWLDDEKARGNLTNVAMKILREDKAFSHYAPCLQTTNAACKYGAENILVHGDNLEALKALLPFYAGRVKCIYIDPPYNTGSAFEHYDDNLEHSTWLNMMYPRLKLLREFLSEDGSIWISIDDREIRVATGEQKELDDVDVTDPTCKVNYVITVQALKEGWDCPFAYVFCSLANVGSSKDTIQLLGRVMRMPYAKRRKTRELNRAYAFVMSDEFGKAAASLTDGLKKKGFDEVEAFKAVEEQLPLQNDLGELFNTPPDVVRLSSDVVNVLDGMMKDCQMLLQTERRHWLASVVADLHRNHGISCEQLVLIRYQLRSRLEWHYLEAIGKAKREAYLQVFALHTPHKLTLDLPGGFVFDEHIYEVNTKVYRGAWRFNKHFLGTYAIPQFDGKKEFGEGEEFECAKHIDAHPKVVSWLRNKDSDPQSFKLPMGGKTDWFYPDFIGELDDGRLFVLEYKGSLTGQSEDTVEKDAIGKLWAAQDPKKYVYATIYGDAKSGLSPEQQVNSVLT